MSKTQGYTKRDAVFAATSNIIEAISAEGYRYMEETGCSDDERQAFNMAVCSTLGGLLTPLEKADKSDD